MCKDSLIIQSEEDIFTTWTTLYGDPYVEAGTSGLPEYELTAERMTVPEIMKFNDFDDETSKQNSCSTANG